MLVKRGYTLNLSTVHEIRIRPGMYTLHTHCLLMLECESHAPLVFLGHANETGDASVTQITGDKAYDRVCTL